MAAGASPFTTPQSITEIEGILKPMAQAFKCPSCGGPLDVDGGQDFTIRCPFCNTSVIVPEELRTDRPPAEPDDSPPAARPPTRTLGQIEEFAEIARLVRAGNKLQAIKLYRQVTGAGLAESKDAIDKIAGGGILEISNVPIDYVPPGPTRDRAAQIAAIGRLLRAGNKIQAIKVYRETFGVGLKEAKDGIDRLETTVDTPGAFDLHPAETAARAGPSHSAPAASGEPDRSAALGGWIIGLFLLAIVAVGLGVAYTTSHRDNPLAALFAAPPGDDAPAPSPTLDLPDLASPMPVATAISLPTPTPGFAEASILVDCSGAGRGCFEDAQSIGVDGEDQIYVGEYAGGRVQVFSPAGEFVTQWRIGDREARLSGLAVDWQGMVVAVSGGELYRHEGATGKPLGRMEYAGGPGFQAVAATDDGGAAASWNRDWQGGLFVNFSESQDDIVVFDSAGAVVNVLPKALSEIAGGNAELDTEITVDGRGNLYAAGSLNPAVYKFDPSGRFVDKFGDGRIRYVTALAVDGRGRVYVADSGGILVFDAGGQYVGTIDASPRDMAFNDRGELLVIEGSRVIRYTMNR